MTPEPGRVRTPPPTFPPAPPGTGTGPESSGGNPSADMRLLYSALVQGLNDLAVIRTTFETLEVFPNDEELQAELSGIAEGARLALQIRLRVAERENVQGEADWAVEARRQLAVIQADLDGFRTEPEVSHARALASYSALLMWLMTQGVDPR